MELALSGTELSARAVPEQHARPDHRVEDDVVLAHEVRVRRVRVLPPVAPCFGCPVVLGPLDGSREVTDHRVEPHVDAFRLRRVALHRHRNAPVDVTRHRARLEVVDEREGEVPDVRPPAGLRLDPRAKPIRERRQVEKEVLRLPEFRRRPVDDRVRLDEVGRIELVTAVVALIAAGFRVAADRTRSFDVAIGKRVPRRRRERAERGLLDQAAVLVEGAEHVGRDASVILRGGAREVVVGDAKVPQVLTRELVVTLCDLTRRHALAIGRNHHRRAVLVRPTHHQDVVALQAVVPREDVRRDCEPHHMSQMSPPGRVWPGWGHQDFLLRWALRHERASPSRGGT